MQKKRKMLDPIRKFEIERNKRIKSYSNDIDLLKASKSFLQKSVTSKYSYNFSWLGRPIIQYPQDIVAFQEIVWNIKPDLIIETGIAHGGSLMLSASLLAMLDLLDHGEAKIVPRTNKPRRVVAVDIDIRSHNLEAIINHGLNPRLTLIEGSSIDKKIIERIYHEASEHENILICLDSNHTHEHVLEELEAYAPLTSIGSYCIVFDTLIDDMPRNFYPDKPWSKSYNPKTAVIDYLKILHNKGRIAYDGKPLNFEIDEQIKNKLLITVAKSGYLKRVCN